MEGLHVLCYQHHSEMLLGFSSNPGDAPPYACQVPGCLVLYHGSRGYFLDTKSANIIEEMTPRVSCSNDGQHMYLAEVKPEERNFRLWKCPECDQIHTNTEDTSGGLGKKMGA